MQQSDSLATRRVLIMTNALTGGGVERVAYEHARLLAEQSGYTVAVALCEPRPDILGGVKQYALVDFRNAHKLAGVLGRSFNAREMRACLDDFLPDIVHIHTYVPFSPGAMSELLRHKTERGCHVVLSHHNYSYACPNDALFDYTRGELCRLCLGTRGAYILRRNCYGHFAASAGKYLQKSAFARIFARGLVDAHTAVSHFVQDILRAHDPGLDARLIANPCFEQALPRIPQKRQGKAVCFGRVSREKNMIAAATALADKSGVTLTLIGDGPAAPELRKFVSGHNNITFINEFLDLSRLHAHIADAEYFIMPSIWPESFGIALVEALDFGMTPLVSDRGSLRELIEYFGVGYVFDPGDPASITSALDEARVNRSRDVQIIAGPVREKLAAFTSGAYLRAIDALYASL